MHPDERPRTTSRKHKSPKVLSLLSRLFRCFVTRLDTVPGGATKMMEPAGRCSSWILTCGSASETGRARERERDRGWTLAGWQSGQRPWSSSLLRMLSIGGALATGIQDFGWEPSSQESTRRRQVLHPLLRATLSSHAEFPSLWRTNAGRVRCLWFGVSVRHVVGAR